jgi:ABC-type multidrug transport system ATPase subunit
LDSFQALRVATTIKDLAIGGRTIVTSVHQPRSSIFALFDDIAILSEGKMCYFGPASKMIPYFTKLGYSMPENFNPGDFILDLVSVDSRSDDVEEETRKRVKDIQDRFQPETDDANPVENVEANAGTNVDSDSDNVEVSHRHKYETPYYRQFLLLFQRAGRQKLRDRLGIIIPFASTLFFATLLGCLYYQTGTNLTQQAVQDKSGALFFLVLSMFLLSFFI